MSEDKLKSACTEEKLLQIEKIIIDTKNKLSESTNQIKLIINSTQQENEQLTQEIRQLEERYYKLCKRLNHSPPNSEV